MKTSELDFKRKHVVEQLHQLGFKNMDGLSYDELVRKLATARALEIDISKDENKWF